MSDPHVERHASDPLTNHVERQSWADFRSAGLLWAANSVLHWFGWCIVVSLDNDTGEVLDVYPARTKWRGFPSTSNEQGIKRLTRWMASAGPSLEADISESEDGQ